MAESDSTAKQGIQLSTVSARWWHFALGLGFVLLLLFLSPRGKSPEFSHLNVGSISPAKIIAPFDFPILKSTEELHLEREAAALAVPPVFNQIDTAKSVTLGRLRQFGTETGSFFSTIDRNWLREVADTLNDWKGPESEAFLSGLRQLSDRFEVHLNWESWAFLTKLYLSEARPTHFQRFFEVTVPEVLIVLYKSHVCSLRVAEIAPGIMNVAIIDGDEESFVPVDSLIGVGKRVASIEMYLRANSRSNHLDSLSFRPASELIVQFLSPSLVLDAEETDRRREAAVQRVPLAKGFVKQDELIIDRHIKVDEDHISKLHSLAVKRAEISTDRGGIGSFLPIFGQFLMITLLSLVLMIGIARGRPEIWQNARLMLLLLIILAMALSFFKLVPIQFDLSRQLLPAAFTALLLTILLDRGMAALGVVTLALAGGFLQGNDYQTATFALVNGGVAIMSLRSLQSRRDVLRTGLYISLVSILMVIAFYFAAYTGDGILLEEILLAVGVGLISPMLVLGVVPLVEAVFGITTDLTLLELVDLNRPLLRQLAIKSPGTYHHSLMVGSLAEAAAREIGANTLLTRAGAYYHDIGKMDIREYFIENQETGSQNIHDRLPPSESARIVIDHVKRGLELAALHRLPPEIRSFITEHHGKTRLAYFYSKAERELGRDVDESKFRYPGPKPQSRETAILMLADGVEAATRSIARPSLLDLKNMVDRFVATRLAEGDLEECPLTLKEISKIKQAFLNVLTGIHHQRIEYPSGNAGEREPPPRSKSLHVHSE